MALTNEDIKAYGNEMYKQMGGNRWVRTCGVKVVGCGEDAHGFPYLLAKLPSLKDCLPEAKVRPNYYKITLDLGSDTYIVEYYYHKPEQMRYDTKTGTVKTLPEKRVSVYYSNDVYCDQLQDIFEKQTGLLCDFCRVVFG